MKDAVLVLMCHLTIAQVFAQLWCAAGASAHLMRPIARQGLDCMPKGATSRCWTSAMTSPPTPEPRHTKSCLRMLIENRRIALPGPRDHKPDEQNNAGR